ncbi:uncharacterized protein IUM83_16829 [Phytophthora cinnamomi]|uniref:uncharacterized protein n=1 Tax=Phytophthora cinnamomi TaxID=4785 RepID=UPI00355A6093|nr:hypothetical protein IUM83_16830 [Phytophthora cinnamomi]KAG6615243.1 hypothetical protein IUM83_16829 [Phytophthora cinnamomi]
MDRGCHAALYEHELPAFAGLDLPPPARAADLADLEGRGLDASLDALDALGLSAPVLALDLDAAALLFADPPGTSACRSRSSSTSARRAASPSRTHKPHHSKKASRRQVLELQAMVNAMQVQVDDAAAEIRQLAQLVGRFAHQRQQQQSLDEHEMDMDLDVQQRQLHAQVERERQQFERLQRQYHDGASAAVIAASLIL